MILMTVMKHLWENKNLLALLFTEDCFFGCLFAEMANTESSLKFQDLKNNCRTMEPSGQDRNVSLKLRNFGLFPCIILYKSC